MYLFQSFVNSLKDSKALRGWARTCLVLGSIYSTNAIEELKKAIITNDELTKTDFLLLGKTYTQTQQYEEAISIYELAYKKSILTKQVVNTLSPILDYLDPWQKVIRHISYPNDSTITIYNQALSSCYGLMEDGTQWCDFLKQWGDFLKSLDRFSESAVLYTRSLTVGTNINNLQKVLETQELIKIVLTECPDKEDTILRINEIYKETNRPARYLEWGILLAQMNCNEQALQQLAFSVDILIKAADEKPTLLPEHWERHRKLLQCFATSPYASKKAINQIEMALRTLKLSNLWINWSNVLCDLQLYPQALDSFYEALLLANVYDLNFENLLEILISASKSLAKHRIKFEDKIQGRLNNIISIDNKLTKIFAGKLEDIKSYIYPFKEDVNTKNSFFLFKISLKILAPSKIDDLSLSEFDVVSWPHLFYVWGRILDKLEKKEQSIKQYKKAIQLEDSFAEAHYDIGQIYCCQGNYGKASREFQKATTCNPKYSEAFFIGG